MSVERLERVLWRLRRTRPLKRDPPVYTNRELRIAIMKECGTSPMTIVNNRRALKELGWIDTKRRSSVELTDKDLGDDL